MSVKYDGKEYEVKREGGLLTLNLPRMGIKKISDIKGLETLTELQSLNLNSNQISEVENLENHINLENLQLGGNLIEIIKGFDNLVNLRVLNLNNNQISEVENLENLTSLEDLQLEKNLIKIIKGLDNLVNLRMLNLYSNNISEIENFGNMGNLRDIFLGGNPIYRTIVNTVGRVTPQTIEQYRKMLSEERVDAKKKIQKAERGGLTSERNFMNENSESKPRTIKDKFSASKVVALIGTIFLILYSITMIISGIVSMYQPRYTIILYFYEVAFGVINLFWGYFLFESFEFVSFRKEHMEHHWIPLLILGVIVTFSTFTMPINMWTYDIYTDTISINPLGVILDNIYPLPGILLIIAAVLEILPKKKKDINIPKVLSLIGAGITIIEVINIIYLSRVYSFLNFTPGLIKATFALIGVIILILSMSKINIRIPFNWWVVFIIGIVVIWCSLLGGVVFMCVVIVILLKY